MIQIDKLPYKIKVNREEALTFDDVVIVPTYSSVKRGETNVTPKPFKNIAPKIPIISSPMSSVTEKDMVEAMFDLGGLGIHHRYCDIEKLMDISTAAAWDSTKCITSFGGGFPIAVGSVPSHKEEIDKLINGYYNAAEGLRHGFFCIDVANGAHENALNTIKYIREKCPEADIMSGNVATPAQAKLCIFAGANIIRIGIGSGSVCTTRVQTGCGVPGLQSILDIKQMLDNPFTTEEVKLFKDIILVSDGGIRAAGDIAKAIVGGSDYIILGKLLAGSDESPGDSIEYITFKPRVDSETKEWNYQETELKNYKLYAGMASKRVLVEQNNKDPNHLHVEGTETLVECTGPVANTINQLINGLKQAMFYTSSLNLEDLKKATFRKVTNNGIIEGTAHALNQ